MLSHQERQMHKSTANFCVVWFFVGALLAVASIIAGTSKYNHQYILPQAFSFTAAAVTGVVAIICARTALKHASLARY